MVAQCQGDDACRDMHDQDNGADIISGHEFSLTPLVGHAQIGAGGTVPPPSGGQARRAMDRIGPCNDIRIVF